MKPPFVLSFGRRKGRTLRDTQKQRLSEGLSEFSIVLAEHNSLDLKQCFGTTPACLHLEIGFGGGEHLAAQAANNPSISYIGCEPFLNGVVSLLGHLEARNITNVRIWKDDARMLLAALPDNILERVYVLFPDPWPKKKHYKRRIINKPLLDLLSTKMQKDAELRIATDHSDYAEWIFQQVTEHPGFDWWIGTASDIKMPPPDWVPTRYQQKAEKQGISASFRLKRL